MMAGDTISPLEALERSYHRIIGFLALLRCIRALIPLSKLEHFLGSDFGRSELLTPSVRLQSVLSGDYGIVPRMNSRLLSFGAGNHSISDLKRLAASELIDPPIALDFVLKSLSHTTKRDTPLATILKKTATQFNILKHILELHSSSIANTALPTFHTMQSLRDGSEMTFITLRQAFYACKPMLSGRSPSTILNSPVYHFKLSKDCDSLEVGQESKVGREINDNFDISDSIATFSTSYVYNSISQMCSVLSAKREHMLLEAEGRAIFSVHSWYNHIRSSLYPDHQHIIDTLSPFQPTELVTNASIRNLQQSLATVYKTLSETTNPLPRISVVAIEKEGVYDQIIQRMNRQKAHFAKSPPLASTRVDFGLISSSFHLNTLESMVTAPSMDSDLFESLVMRPILEGPSSTSLRPSSSSHSTSIIFLVCLKGMPCHAVRKLLRVLEQFRLLISLSYRSVRTTRSLIHGNRFAKRENKRVTDSSSMKRNRTNCEWLDLCGPIQVFVDCNPAGMLILDLLRRDLCHGDDPENDGGEFQLNIEWCALRPSQWHLLPRDKVNLLQQPFTTLDTALMRDRESRNWKDWEIEFTLMRASESKLELQCLFM